MVLTKDDFLERQAEIRLLYEHLVKVSSTPKNVKISGILKASVFIALYNNIEATFYSIFEKIHEEFHTVKFSLLNDKLQILVKDYHGSSSIEDCHDLKLPKLIEYIKKKRLFSGNLDTKECKNLFQKYGIKVDIDFNKKKSESLLIIKNKRNKIAHGEVSLHAGGRDINNTNLLKIIDNSQEIVIIFIDIAKKFLPTKA